MRELPMTGCEEGGCRPLRFAFHSPVHSTLSPFALSRRNLRNTNVPTASSRDNDIQPRVCACIVRHCRRYRECRRAHLLRPCSGLHPQPSSILTHAPVRPFDFIVSTSLPWSCDGGGSGHISRGCRRIAASRAWRSATMATLSGDTSGGSFALVLAASLFHSCASNIPHPSSSFPLHGWSPSCGSTHCLAVPCTCSRTASDRKYSHRWREHRAILWQVPRAGARVRRLRSGVGDRTRPREACRIACCMPCRSSGKSRGDSFSSCPHSLPFIGGGGGVLSAGSGSHGLTASSAAFTTVVAPFPGSNVSRSDIARPYEWA